MNFCSATGKVLSGSGSTSVDTVAGGLIPVSLIDSL
jgi:hypothetical protein